MPCSVTESHAAAQAARTIPACPSVGTLGGSLSPRLPVTFPSTFPPTEIRMPIETKRTGSNLEARVHGRLDATTAPDLESAVDLAGVQVLVVDLDRCDYVSSAGLRVFLGFSRRLSAVGGSLVLTNARPEVERVLEITGLASLMHLRPKVREVSIDGLEKLSAGVCGECFRLDRETVLKLYNEGVAPEVAEQEKRFAKAAFVAGIPTAISYDVVACGSRTGVVYELLDAELFSAVVLRDPGNVDRHAAMLASVARAVHTTTADPEVFPDLKERLCGYIRQMDFFLGAADIDLLLEELAAIPDADTCVHFDLHTSNIMIRDGEPVIIDMGDLSRGHYLFDLGLATMIYGLPESGICEMATKIPTDVGVQLWERFLAHYFEGLPAAERALFLRHRDFLASLRAIYTNVFLPRLRPMMVPLVRDVLMPRIREAAGR